MMTQEQTRQLATRWQTTELNIQREYYQHLILSAFYQQPSATTVYFKGGTALRLIYHSPRFSEDLDFSSPGLSETNFQNLLKDSIAETHRVGVAAHIVEAKSTTSGYLATLEFSGDYAPIQLLVEVSLRHSGGQGQAVTVANDFVLPYTLLQLAEEQLMAEKVQALLTRQKPRDFYDLYFILRGNLLPIQLRPQLSEVARLLKRSETNFEFELKQFLPKSHWLMIRSFREALEREIHRFIS